MKTICSPNFDARETGVPIDMLVIHYTGMQTCDSAIARMCSPVSRVSAHFCIQEDGNILQLVKEENRAWHAGVAFWRGFTNINSRSIGIEVVNPGHDFGYAAFPNEQILSLENLCLDLLARHDIPAQNIVGHSDIAPRRKRDPGELFPWERMASLGIGLWPDKISSTVSEPAINLGCYGYEIESLKSTIEAFQRHYRQNCVNGVWDFDCAARLAALRNLA